MAKQIGFVLLRACRTRTNFPLLKSRIPMYQGIRLQNTSSRSQSQISKYIEKTRNVFNEPFVKISLMALAAVMSATALYEYLYRGSAKKKSKLGIHILPVSPNHYCVERSEYISQLEEECATFLNLPLFSNIKVVFLTGLSASGKSQIARLYAEKYAKKFKVPIVKPPVIATLSGDSIENYLSSLRSLAVELGSTPSDWSRESDDGTSFSNLSSSRQIEIIVEEVSKKLKASGGRWLLIIDNLKSDCGIKQAWWPQSDQSDIWGKGCVLITCNETLTPNLIEQVYDKAPKILKVKKRLTESEATSLLHQISGDQLPTNPTMLINLLLYSPLAISLTGTYIKLKNGNSTDNIKYDYDSFIKEFEAIRTDILNRSSGNQFENNESLIDKIVTGMCIQQCSEIDQRMHSIFDVLGAFEPRRPVPVTVVKAFTNDNEITKFRLSSQTKILEANNSDLKSQELNPSAGQVSKESEQNANNSENDSTQDSGIIRTFIAEGKKIYRTYFSSSSLEGGNKQQDDTEDDNYYIQKCPLLWRDEKSDIETISVHPTIHSVMQNWYLLATIPMMEKLHLSEQKIEGKSSWFGQVKAFDEVACLEAYRRKLCEQFNLKFEPSNNEAQSNLIDQISLISNLVLPVGTICTSYHEAQKYSLLRYISKSVVAVTKNRRSEVKYRKTCKLLLPHFASLMNRLQAVDLKKFSELLDTVAMIHSDVLNEDMYSIEMLKHSLSIKKKIYGDKEYQIAHTLTLLGIVLNSLNRLDESKASLEEALSIFNSLPAKKIPDPQQVRSLATTLSTLGVVCSNLGDHKRSRELLERALSLMQSIQPQNSLGIASDEIFNHAADVATMLTDIGHSYLLNGETSSGHRLLQFALNIHQNIHGEEHYEVVRTLTVLSVAQMIQGFHEDSKKSRDRAGAIRASLNSIVVI